MSHSSKNTTPWGSISLLLTSFLLTAFFLAELGCGGGGKTLESISVAPSAPSIQVGSTQQLTATGTYSDGTTQDLTASATWASSDTSVATVAAGLASGLGPGTTAITASSGSVTSSQDMLTVKLVPTLTSIAIQPATSAVGIGATEQLTAWGTYSDGSHENITDSVIWSSSDVSVATISTDGLVTGVGTGTAVLGASYQALTGTAQVTVP